MDDVLIDTGAGLGDASLSLQLAADRVILITTPEPTSLVDAYATLKILWTADPDKPVDIVANDVQDDDEAERVREQIGRAARQFLGQEPGWLGPVYHDPKVTAAVRRQRAVLGPVPRLPGRGLLRADRPATALGGRRLRRRGSPEDYWERLMLPADKELPN